MSNLFETDINKWLPEDASKPAEDRVEELGRVVGFLAVSLNKTLERVEQAEKTIEHAQKVAYARAALHMDYIERLENLVAKCCAKCNISVPFLGQDDDFGLSPKPKKE